MTLSRRARERLPRSLLGCPDTLNYPLDTAKRVRNALSRAGQAGTVKCPGLYDRICRAAKQKGIKSAVCERRG